MFDILLLTLIGVLYVHGFFAYRALEKTIENLEARLDDVERGEFKDYGRGDDEFGV